MHHIWVYYKAKELWQPFCYARRYFRACRRRTCHINCLKITELLQYRAVWLPSREGWPLLGLYRYIVDYCLSRVRWFIVCSFRLARCRLKAESRWCVWFEFLETVRTNERGLIVKKAASIIVRVYLDGLVRSRIVSRLSVLKSPWSLNRSGCSIRSIVDVDLYVHKTFNLNSYHIHTSPSFISQDCYWLDDQRGTLQTDWARVGSQLYIYASCIYSRIYSSI